MPRCAAGAVLLICFTCGCSTTRTFTIYSKPADARLIIDGVERGPGPITQQFEFKGSGDVRRVTAVRRGYKTRTEFLTADTPHDTVVINLDPLGPRVIFSVVPVAAMVRVNGEPLARGPTTSAEITLDAQDPEKTYTITAERAGYETATRTVKSTDAQGYYQLVLRPVVEEPTKVARADPPRLPVTQPAPRPMTTTRAAPTPLQPLKRDLVIRTDPPNARAEIFIGEQKWGDNEARIDGFEFKRDPLTGKSIPQAIRAAAPGFEGGAATLRWEDNRQVYVVPLGRRKKDVRIIVDPPDATVTIDGQPVKPDRNGVVTWTVLLPPGETPDRPATVIARATKEGAGTMYEPAEVKIGWDDGKRDYQLKLVETKVVRLPMLRVVPVWQPQVGWRGEPRRFDTVATRDTSEGPGRQEARPLAEVPAGTMLDSVIASPDGSHVLYTALEVGQDGTARSRMRLLNSDGTPAGSLPSDGRHLDVMPSFTPDGQRIYFTSDRSGQGLDVWSMAVAAPGNGDVKQVARAGEKAALWPMIDASPQPRLFYEELPKPLGTTPARSEVHFVEIEAPSPVNIPLAPGSRPRASPRADAVVFTRPDPQTGKRDLWMITDKEGVALAGDAVNLTNTPDVDECDPAWSRSGGKIAFASDAGADETNRRNYDLYVLTVADPAKQTRVTYNGSHDDSPAWDATGKSLYFRSNRGGKWGVWTIAVP